jgi:hypothetical protein
MNVVFDARAVEDFLVMAGLVPAIHVFDAR